MINTGHLQVINQRVNREGICPLFTGEQEDVSVTKVRNEICSEVPEEDSNFSMLNVF